MEYEGVRQDILKEVSPPAIDTAYSWVKKEAARRRIGQPNSSNTTTEAATAVLILDLEESVTGSLHKDRGNPIGVETHGRQPPPTAREASRRTSRNYGAPIAGCKSIHGRPASN